MPKKQYADYQAYEKKLEKVMARLGVEQYDYDWTRRDCYIQFLYKGKWYRFEHSLEKAKEAGSSLLIVSDLFAQLVLTLEDLARAAERKIYDLAVFMEGLKMIPEANTLPRCFQTLGFKDEPKTKDEVIMAYRMLAKVRHPDVEGGSDEAFQTLREAYNEALVLFSEDIKSGIMGE